MVDAPKLDRAADNRIADAQRDAKLLGDLDAKLPAELQYKHAEIQAMATAWDELAIAYDAKFEAWVVTQRCPAGKAATGEFAKQVKDEWGADEN
jgi:hypothetical protein